MRRGRENKREEREEREEGFDVKITFGDLTAPEQRGALSLPELYLPRDVNKLDSLSNGLAAHNHTIGFSNWRRMRLSGASGEVVWEKKQPCAMWKGSFVPLRLSVGLIDHYRFLLRRWEARHGWVSFG